MKSNTLNQDEYSPIANFQNNISNDQTVNNITDINQSSQENLNKIAPSPPSN